MRKKLSSSFLVILAVLVWAAGGIDLVEFHMSNVMLPAAVASEMDPITDAVFEAMISGEEIFAEDWEWGIGTWQPDGSSAWQVGPTTTSPSIPESQGLNCAGTTLTGDHPESSSGRLTKWGIELDPVSGDERITLWFKQYVDCYNSSDYGRVQVHDGVEWHDVSVKQYYPTAGWHWYCADLTSFAGSTVGLAFYFRSSDTLVSYPYDDSRRGWYVDQITIRHGVISPFPVPDGFESGQGDWYATNGLWSVGTPTSGPGSAYRGVNSVSTVRTGDHPEWCYSRFISPRIQIPDLGTGATVNLHYHVWYNTYNSSDYLEVYVSIDDGDWILIDGPLSGYSSGWKQRVRPIPDCAGHSIRLDYRYKASDTLGSYPYDDSKFGVSIDNIYFEGVGLLAHELYPRHGAYNVSEASTIEVHFNNPVDVTTVNASNFQVLGTESGPISGTFEFHPEGIVFEFTPDDSFATDEIITCRLTENVLDMHGNPIDGNADLVPGGELVWEFCTFDDECIAAPPPPQGVAAIVSGNDVILNWDANPDDGKTSLYRIYRDTGTTPAQIDSVLFGIETYTDSSGDSGTQYIYWVSAYREDNGRESVLSTSVCATPGDQAAPGQPGDFVGDDGNSVVNLFWAGDPECDVVSYEISRNVDGGAFAPIDTVSAQTTRYLDAGLINDTEYCYFLQAVDNAELVGAPTDTLCFTPNGPDADLALTMAVSDSTPNLYESVTYTIAVYNNGPDTAKTVVVVDTIPAGMSLDGPALMTRGSYTESTGDWVLGQMNPQQTDTLWLTMSIDSNIIDPNVATVADIAPLGSSDSVPDNNTGEVIITPQACDLVITTTVSDPTPNVNEEVVLKVIVFNEGPVPAMGVEVRDHLPNSLFVNRITKSAGTYIDDVWRLDTVPVGVPDSLVIRATVNSASAITNSAEAIYSEPPDANEDNNSDSVTFVGEQCDLVLTKTPDNWVPEVGTNVTFTLLVENKGPSTASNIFVVDAVPAGLTYVSATTTVGAYSEDTWSIPQILAYQSASLDLVCQVDSSGAISNVAHISGFDQSDPDPNNNQVSITLSAESADLALTKVVDLPTTDIGDTVTFTLTLTNHGPNDASGIQVMDQVPPGMTFHDVEPSAGSYEAGSGLWSLDELLFTESATLDIRATVDLPISLSNTASLFASTTRDTFADNNSASVSVTGEAADLAVTATVSGSSNPRPAVGDTVTFIIELTNNGPSDVVNVAVMDTIPDGLHWIGENPSDGYYNNLTGEWLITNLIPSGGTETLSIDTVVDVAETTTNHASASSDKPDPRADNDRDSVTLYQKDADLALTKEASELFPILNTEFTYTIAVTNNGPDEIATGIVVQDELPTELTFTSQSADVGSYDPITGLWNLGSLLEYETATLTITVVGDTEATVINSASIIALDQSDDNHNDNSADATVHVTDPPPVIVPATVATLPIGESVTVSATITDNTNVAGATLHYRSGMIANYTPVIMTRTTDDTFEGTIPGGWVNEDGLFCYISAMDDADHEGNSDHIPLSVVVPNTVKDDEQPGGSEVSAYQIIGAPLDLDNKSIRSVLEDDLGEWDHDEWRIWSLDDDEHWVEHKNGNGSMLSARGFMLIVKAQGKYLDSGSGVTVPMHEPFTVNLHEGWNMVSNPFNIPVNQSNLSFVSSPEALGVGYLQKYQATWVDWTAGAIVPWEGFIVYTNNDNEQLLIDPGLPVEKRAPVKTPPSLWTVNIEARAQRAIDNNNNIVILPEASVGRDFYDYPEPPAIGKYVSLSFPHPEFNEPARCFRQDARPDIDQGDIWNLEVRTNVEDMVHLNFSGIECVPDEYQVWLHDELLELNINLRESTKYSFVGTSEQYTRHLKLVIGNENYIQTEMPAGELMPQRVELSQNFPNPFNPLTTIKFGMPHEAKVRLCIYDVRGRLVTKLLDNKLLPAGRYAEVWNGTDHADRRVASGVYLYRLQVGDAVKTQKMVLMK